MYTHIYVFCSPDNENDSENWRKFDFRGENHEKPMKIVVFCVYLSKYGEFLKMFVIKVVDLVKVHIFCFIHIFSMTNTFREKG